MNYPKLQGKLAGGTIELFHNRYALIKQCKNPSQVQYANYTPVYHYHIVKLAMNGRGWCNGRYDLPDNGETILKFYSLAK
jgi:hypothetical protein